MRPIRIAARFAGWLLLVVIAYLFYGAMELLSLGGLMDNPLSEWFAVGVFATWPGDLDLFLLD